MPYDKPKVTIDLEEYQELKKQASQNIGLKNIEIGYEVVLVNPDRSISIGKVTNREVKDNGQINYFAGSAVMFQIIPSK